MLSFHISSSGSPVFATAPATRAFALVLVNAPPATHVSAGAFEYEGSGATLRVALPEQPLGAPINATLTLGCPPGAKSALGACGSRAPAPFYH